jgi:hypothetical protein
MGKLFGLHSEVTRDGRQVHHPEFYYGLSRAVRSHIDAKAGGFSSQGQDDEQFRLKPTRSTAFKVWLKVKARGEVKFASSAIIFRILFEWNNIWLRYKRRFSPLSTIIMDLEERLSLRHRPLAYHILFEWDKSGDLTRRKPFSQESSLQSCQPSKWIMR